MQSCTIPTFPAVFGGAIHRRQRQLIICSSSPPATITRRVASLALLAGAAIPNSASAGGPFDKYVKRKKLDPLEAYIPAVLLSRDQFEELHTLLDIEQPEYDVGRSLLRSGPAGSLRVNIRAVAQYATDDGKGEVASDAVEKCLRALEDLDSLLLRASRKDQAVSIESMRNKITIAIAALDSTDCSAGQGEGNCRCL